MRFAFNPLVYYNKTMNEITKKKIDKVVIDHAEKSTDRAERLAYTVAEYQFAALEGRVKAELRAIMKAEILLSNYGILRVGKSGIREDKIDEIAAKAIGKVSK